MLRTNHYHIPVISTPFSSSATEMPAQETAASVELITSPPDAGVCLTLIQQKRWHHKSLFWLGGAEPYSQVAFPVDIQALLVPSLNYEKDGTDQTQSSIAIIAAC
jgi:hypothetical protein